MFEEEVKWLPLSAPLLQSVPNYTRSMAYPTTEFHGTQFGSFSVFLSSNKQRKQSLIELKLLFLLLFVFLTNPPFQVICNTELLEFHQQTLA